MPAPDLVLSGHPGADTVPQSPALSKDRWEAILEGGVRDMETLLARFEADGADFLDGHPKRILPDLYYLGDFQGAAVYGFIVASRFFLVDAPGGPGLSEFVSDQLRKLGRDRVATTAVLLTSCGGSETGGLADLVEKGRFQVGAAAAGLSGLAPKCPAGTVFVPAEGLKEKGWFEVKASPLAGRGESSVAYLIPWHGKTVLFSGRIPARRPLPEPPLPRVAIVSPGRCDRYNGHREPMTRHLISLQTAPRHAGRFRSKDRCAS